MRDTFVGTIIQSAPRFRQLVSCMRPTWHMPSLGAITPEFIEEHGIRGVIWDVDGTITEHHATDVAPNAARGFNSLLASPSLHHVILSNADERRFVELGRLFPAIPVVRGYLCGDAIAFRTVRGETDDWSPRELAERLRNGAVPLRKPAAALVDHAITQLPCESSATVMIGDQYLTDVAGANLAGIRSIKVPTLGRRTFPLPVRLSQVLEGLVYRARYGMPPSTA